MGTLRLSRRLLMSAVIAIAFLLPAFVAGAQSSAATSKFVTIDFQVMGDPPANGEADVVLAKINDYLKQKINANMRFRWTSWTDWQTQYNLLVATGQGLDLVTAASDWLDLWPNASKGAWMALDDLLPKYAPKTFAEIPRADWDQTRYNGKIVALPENSYTQYVNHGLFYRGDWARKAGISKITSWDDVTRYLDYIKKNIPGVIPWDNANNWEHAEGWLISHTEAVPVDAVAGRLVYFKSFKSDPYTVYSPFFDKTFDDFAALMKQWADAGYWKADVLNNKDDTRQFLRDGKTGMDEHHVQTYAAGSTSLRNLMDKDQPGSDLQMFGFFEPTKNLIRMPILHGATALSAGSKNPERAMMLYEQIRQDKTLYMLLNYGVQNRNYYLDEKGQLYVPKDFDLTKFQFYSDFWGGRVDKFEPVNASMWSGHDAYIKYLDGFSKPYIYTNFVFNQSPVSTQVAAISQVANSMIPAISLGMAGDPAKAVADFRSQLKSAGIDQVIAEVQKQVNAWKASIGK
jgi:putative aldouronate transport system substrate-binding protein